MINHSSTKIVFRSSQEREKIAKAINLQELHFTRLQQLPIRHCFFWKDGQEEVSELITVDFILTPLKYAHYLLFLKRKYHSSTYPLLFNSFIDMRAALYDKLSTSKQFTKKRKEKLVEVNQLSKIVRVIQKKSEVKLN